MKKIVTSILALVLCLSLFACGGKDNDNDPANTTPDASATTPEASDTQTPDSTGGGNGDEDLSVEDALSGVIEMLYEKSPVELALSTMPVDLTNADSVKAITGLEDGSKLDGALVSETMIGSQAYSLVLVRVKDEADAEAVKKEMIDGINPRKWICVGADEVRAINSGKVVMLVMMSSELEAGKADALCDAFVEIFGSENCGERLSRVGE